MLRHYRSTIVSQNKGPLGQKGAGAYLLPHFPQALHTAEQVAAPQQLAAQPSMVPMLGTAISGIESNAPILNLLA